MFITRDVFCCFTQLNSIYSSKNSKLPGCPISELRAFLAFEMNNNLIRIREALQDKP